MSSLSNIGKHDSHMNARSSGSPSEEATGYPKKRERTRRRLVTAGMVVIARRGPDGATVGEIAGEAGVSPGTFYNHFPSLMDLVETMTGDLQTRVEIGSATLESIDNDPATRVAIGTRQLLSLVDEDPPAAAAFVALLATIPAFRSRIRAVIQGVVRSGVESEDFQVSDVGAATDAILGSIVQWIRSDLAKESGSVAAADRADLALRMLGMSRRGSAKAVSTAFGAAEAGSR